MRHRKPTDDPKVQQVMVATYDSIQQQVEDPSSLPYIGDIRDGVDDRLMRLQQTAKTSLDKEVSHVDQNMRLIKGLVGLFYYFRFGKILQSP